jgi:hypothetical protein
MALVAGKNRVPSPATGKTALRIGFISVPLGEGREDWRETRCCLNLVQVRTPDKWTHNRDRLMLITLIGFPLDERNAGRISAGFIWPQEAGRALTVR